MLENEEGYRFYIADSSEDLEGSFRVRSEVFTGEQGIPRSLVFDDKDGKAIHVAVSRRGKIIGTARIVFPEPKIAKLERMAIVNSSRSSGVGRKLVEFIIDEMIARKMDRIILHAQSKVTGFYEHCGFSRKGETFMEAGIEHVEMEQGL